MAKVIRYERTTERLVTLEGQVSFINEAEALSEETQEETWADEVIITISQKLSQTKQCDAVMKGLLEEAVTHCVP